MNNDFCFFQIRFRLLLNVQSDPNSNIGECGIEICIVNTFLNVLNLQNIFRISKPNNEGKKSNS